MASEKAAEKTYTPPGKPKADAPTVRATEATPPPPMVSGLLPPTAAVGDPSFGLRVLGHGFNEASVIVFAGNPEPTTYFSEGELSTGMNMPLWLGADNLPVLVRNADGQESNTVTFVLAPPREVPLDPAEASKPTPAVDLI